MNNSIITLESLQSRIVKLEKQNIRLRYFLVLFLSLPIAGILFIGARLIESPNKVVSAEKFQLVDSVGRVLATWSSNETSAYLNFWASPVKEGMPKKDSSYTLMLRTKYDGSSVFSMQCGNNEVTTSIDSTDENSIDFWLGDSLVTRVGCDRSGGYARFSQTLNWSQIYLGDIFGDPVLFLKKNGSLLTSIGCNYEGGYAKYHSANDESGVYLGHSNGYPYVGMNDNKGIQRIRYSFDRITGKPFISLYDANGLGRAVLGSTTTKKNNGYIDYHSESSMWLFDENNNSILHLPDDR